jgi:putative transposase
MARKPRVLIKGGIYHVTCRGNERRNIFTDDRDRLRLLKRLGESAAAHQVRIYLYCLMSNHLHLLVETPGGNISRFMSSLLTGYTVYFNRRHRRTGHLMQGRYGAQVVAGDAYLRKLSRYVHLNPVQIEGIRELPLPDRIRQLHAYRWSSFREYAGTAAPAGWLETGPLLAMFRTGTPGSAQKAYVRFVEQGLADTDVEFRLLMARGGVAIGAPEFVEKVRGQMRQQAETGPRSEAVRLRAIRTWKSPNEVTKAVQEVAGDAWREVFAYKTGRGVRGLLAWALRRYAGLTQAEIAPHVQVGTASGVSRMIHAAMAADSWERWQAGLESRIKV